MVFFLLSVYFNLQQFHGDVPHESHYRLLGNGKGVSGLLEAPVEA